jgi:cobyrinic acid a,c-diamide synthase
MHLIHRLALCLCLSAFASMPAAAQDQPQTTVVPVENVRLDYAQVLSVEPVYQTLRASRTEMRCEEIPVPKPAPLVEEGRWSRIVDSVKGVFVRAPAPEPKAEPAKVRVAIARGPAFSFHYEENLELLTGAGAELAEFDPLHDEALPEDTDALILAGGFPEIFGEELSANEALRSAVAAFDGPILAECGGLLYLAETLDERPMCGVLPVEAHMTGRLTLGYREATSLSDHPVWPKGTVTRGHEFHYSTVSAAGNAWEHHRGREGHVEGKVHASYLHTHWAATPEVADRLVAACG